MQDNSTIEEEVQLTKKRDVRHAEDVPFIDNVGDLPYSPCLSNNKVTKLRYAIMINRETSQPYVIDNQIRRLHRLQAKVHDWASLMSKLNCFWVMYTLTYRPGDDYKPNHIRDFIRAMRKGFGKKLLGYCWVAELQKRGVLHYHVEVCLIRGTYAPKPDMALWWLHGRTGRVVSIRSPFYVLSYTGKEHQKEFDKFPRGARAFSTWIADKDLSLKHRYKFLPSWLKGIVDSDGWGAVRFYKKLHKELNNWVAFSFHKSKQEAVNYLGPYSKIYGLRDLILCTT